jgi:hypothetical protein
LIITVEPSSPITILPLRQYRNAQPLLQLRRPNNPEGGPSEVKRPRVDSLAAVPSLTCQGSATKKKLMSDFFFTCILRFSEMAIVTGTSGSDVITSIFTSIGVVGQHSSDADQINAGAGDYFISGGTGNDVVNGESGIDTISDSDSTAAVSVSLSSGLATGGGGNDTLNGGAGTDDVANYSLIGASVTLSAQGVFNKGTSLGSDNLIGIERIIGSNLLGDTVDLSGAIAPATSTTANLTSGLITINGPCGVLLINGTPLSFNVSPFENVTGSSLADTITGNSSDNILLGGNGNAFISGELGIDFITGNAGKDTLLGGADNDADTFVFTSFADSLLANFDVIGDFTNIDIIDRPGQLFASINTSNGIAAGLSASQPGTILNNFSFTANSTKAFTALGFSGTFLAFNDGSAGFNELTDSIVHLISFNLGGTNTITIV